MLDLFPKHKMPCILHCIIAQNALYFTLYNTLYNAGNHMISCITQCIVQCRIHWITQIGNKSTIAAVLAIQCILDVKIVIYVT